MSKLLTVAVIGASHPGLWDAGKYAAAAGCADHGVVNPGRGAISLQYKIAPAFREAGIRRLVEKPRSEAVPAARAMPNLMIQNSDIIPDLPGSPLPQIATRGRAALAGGIDIASSSAI